jgi:predicted signal transduction protein with EAL and GGDEF domain
MPRLLSVQNGTVFASLLAHVELGGGDLRNLIRMSTESIVYLCARFGRGIFDDHGNFAGSEIIAVDVTEQRTLEEQLRHQASSDSLTGLGNHRRLFEVLHAEICRSKRTGREFSLLLLDLDGLKQVNDRFSHLRGDRALSRLGQILRDCCRSIDKEDE